MRTMTRDAAPALEPTATRVWKRLSPVERKTAAEAFFTEPAQEVVGAALGAIVKARHLRPQAARSLPPEEQARILSGVLDPGEALASTLLVALHLKARRPLLVAFLDAVGLPHEDGILKEEADAAGPLDEDKVRTAARSLQAAFPVEEVRVYLNTLFLQDPDRWRVLEKCPQWLAP
jgi:hypothetical protein